MAARLVDLMLENAACASQNRTLLDDPVTRGAVLRSIHQWLRLSQEASPGLTATSLQADIREHEDYYK